jgi:hypothetical protein
MTGLGGVVQAVSVLPAAARARANGDRTKVTPPAPRARHALTHPSSSPTTLDEVEVTPGRHARESAPLEPEHRGAGPIHRSGSAAWKPRGQPVGLRIAVAEGPPATKPTASRGGRRLLTSSRAGPAGTTNRWRIARRRELFELVTAQAPPRPVALDGKIAVPCRTASRARPSTVDVHGLPSVRRFS